MTADAATETTYNLTADQIALREDLLACVEDERVLAMMRREIRKTNALILWVEGMFIKAGPDMALEMMNRGIKKMIDECGI